MAGSVCRERLEKTKVLEREPSKTNLVLFELLEIFYFIVGKRFL